MVATCSEKGIFNMNIFYSKWIKLFALKRGVSSSTIYSLNFATAYCLFFKRNQSKDNFNQTRNTSKNVFNNKHDNTLISKIDVVDILFVLQNKSNSRSKSRPII